ncbi:DUF4870 family protein [Ideonella sp.]|uniref:DUF4870 family protein n=1 Tax=Ideonella sp. TaxID=1929293 RepID=UPI0035B284C2
MNDTSPLVPMGDPGAQKLASLKQLTLIIYVLYALGAFIGLTALVAIIINYVKRDDTVGTIYESHFTWQIRTFWFGLLWAIVGGITVIIGVGFLVLLANSVWLIYRIVKGFLYWNDGKAIGVPAAA